MRTWRPPSICPRYAELRALAVAQFKKQLEEEAAARGEAGGDRAAAKALMDERWAEELRVAVAEAEKGAKLAAAERQVRF